MDPAVNESVVWMEMEEGVEPRRGCWFKASEEGFADSVLLRPRANMAMIRVEGQRWMVDVGVSSRVHAMAPRRMSRNTDVVLM